MNEIRRSTHDLHQRINREQTRYANTQKRVNTIAFFPFCHRYQFDASAP